MRPIRSEILLYLWYICTNASPHKEFCRPQSTPRNWCCLIAGSSVLEISFFSVFTVPSARPLDWGYIVWTAGCVSETVSLCKFFHLLQSELRSIVTPKLNRYTVAGEYGFQRRNDSSRCEWSQLLYFRISGIVIHHYQVCRIFQLAQTFSHGWLGRDDSNNSSTGGGVFFIHLVTKFSTCLDISGHHTKEETWSRHLWIPWCPWCIFIKISYWRLSGMTTLIPYSVQYYLPKACLSFPSTSSKLPLLHVSPAIHSGHTVLTLIYGTTKNNHISNCSTPTGMC